MTETNPENQNSVNQEPTFNPAPHFLPKGEAPYFPKPKSFTPERLFPKDWGNSPYRGKPRCIAWNSRKGQQCENMPRRGETTCRKHGANGALALKGKAVVSGAWSKYLPKRMMSSFKMSMQDPELIALRESISAIDARLADILKRVDKGEAGAIWDGARAAYRATRIAMEQKDPIQTKVNFEDLGHLIDRGAGDYAAWREFFALVEQRRKTVESEQKRLVQMGQMISSERAMTLFSAVGQIMRDEISNPDEMTRIAIRLATLMDDHTPDPVYDPYQDVVDVDPRGGDNE
jgi:hypothetical protein